MLETLNQIPWATLEHAYGNAADIPDKIRALIANNQDERAWARDMLQMGPFHQGSIYACTPYVARFLIEIAQANTVPERDWIFTYLSDLMQAAVMRLSQPHAKPDDDEFDEWLRMTRGEFRKRERAIADQIHSEIHPYSRQFFAVLDDPSPEIRSSIAKMLVMLPEERVHAGQVLQRALVAESDETTRTVFAFCLGIVTGEKDFASARPILENEGEASIVRLAAGFGLVASLKEHCPKDLTESFAALFSGNMHALSHLDFIHQTRLSDLGDERLLAILRHLPVSQRKPFIAPLLTIYPNLPKARDSNLRIGSKYYLATLIMLAFPNGKLSAEATIHSLNEVQRAILLAFQTYDMPEVTARGTWNVYSPEDYRQLLGLELRNEAEFLDFMAGKRPAHATKAK